MQHTTNEYEKLLEDHIKQYIEILDKTKDSIYCLLDALFVTISRWNMEAKFGQFLWKILQYLLKFKKNKKNFELNLLN